MLQRLRENGVTGVVMVKFAVLAKEGDRISEDEDEAMAEELRESLTGRDVISAAGGGRFLALMVDRTEEEADDFARGMIMRWMANPANAKYSVTYDKEML